MSDNNTESFNVNLLGNAEADETGGMTAGATGADSDAAVASSFASELAGGGDNEFVIPEQKKQLSPATIVVVALVAIAGGGLWYMNQRTGGPSPAAAADPESSAAQESIKEFLAGGASSVQEMRDLLNDAEQIQTRFESFGDGKQVPLESLKTNPFYLESLEEESTGAPADRSKEQEDARAKREAERLQAAESQAAKDADALDLKFIFHGKNPSCMINGKICHVGQTVADFEVVSIQPDVVEVRREDWQFELRIRK